MSPTAVAAGPSSRLAGVASAGGFPFPVAPGGVGTAVVGAPPARSYTTSVAWTLTTSPLFPRVSSTRPALGDAIVTVALSVMISTSGWSSRTTSPGLTCHSTISPSVTPSPTSGSLNS
jgi:hypothetical protein